MITKEYATQCLRYTINDDNVDFRDGQWEAIDGILNYRRQLVVQRTGWGKSMIYFLAAKFLREEGRGMTLLISPLLSLMRNQITAAKRTGIKCCTINSTNPNDWQPIKEQILSNSVDLLIISPERLANDTFNLEILEKVTDRIGLLVIDEAHCVSDWGHDFRPDYQKISRLLKHLPLNVPVLATTATATTRVIEDIKAQMGTSVQVSRGNLVRKSLYLQNIQLNSQESRLAWLVETLNINISGSGIIYALTKRDAELVARWLRLNKISAYAYTSNVMPPEEMELHLKKKLESLPKWQAAHTQNEYESVYRHFLEDLLLSNQIKALVATSALSMGFDKPDLAFVIHYQRPKSVIDYYQQVGRAGRGIQSAYGILLNGEEDDRIADYFIQQAFPKADAVEQVLNLIKNAPRGLSINELQQLCNLRKAKIEHILKFVMAETPQPIVKDGSKFRATHLVQSYRIPLDRIHRLTEIRKAECYQMDEYVKTEECLMSFLCKALESPMEETQCNHCVSCCPQLKLPSTTTPSMEQHATEFLHKTILPIKSRKKWADLKTAQNRFGTEQVKNTNIPETLRMEDGRSLSLYGVGMWGKLVKKGKYNTLPPRFDDKLVEACEKMLQKWQMTRTPSWIVPIPSHTNNELVADFAKRLAKRLNIPCWCGLKKKTTNTPTPPQKNMENSTYQQNNVINAFVVEDIPPAGGCILVDDMVDSVWTLTVAAAVLRQAGADFVIPLALADSSNGEK